MSRETITKRLCCKRVVYLNPTGRPSLQAKLTESLSRLKKVGNRKEILGEDSNYVRTIIYHRPYANMLFGILASYERGTHQLTVADDDDAEMLTVVQVAPPKTNDDKRQEFLDGVCYFGISKNIVVAVPSQSLGTKPLEQHLNWILSQSGQLEMDNRIGLKDEIAQATRERIMRSHVKEVEFGTQFIDFDQSLQTSSNKQLTENFNYRGIGVDLLRKLIGKDKVNSMRLSDAVDGNIEVMLKVRYNRNTTEKGHKLLDNIALAVRHLDEDDVKLKLVGGGNISGNELKLSSPVRVQALNGIPNPDELFDKMRNWLLNQIENNIIEP